MDVTEEESSQETEKKNKEVEVEKTAEKVRVNEGVLQEDLTTPHSSNEKEEILPSYNEKQELLSNDNLENGEPVQSNNPSTTTNALKSSASSQVKTSIQPSASSPVSLTFPTSITTPMATSPSIVAPTLTSPTTQPPTATSPSIQPSSPTTQPPLVDVGGLDKTIYKVKWIEFGLRSSAIITQNENGPCPLISIMNILLLRGKLSLPAGAEIVSAEQLLEYLGDLLLDLSSQRDPDLQRNINDAIAVLPRLSTGLDVNVKFTGVQHFEYTPEMLIFDILNMNLYHGWLVDPQNKETCLAVNSLSYNQLVEKIITDTGSRENELVAQSLIAQQFLEESATQLTYHGLYELTQQLDEQELAVFFRNNHFSTLHKKKGQLFLLVTDQGFLGQEDLVWETLGNIEGDSSFVNHVFQATGVDPRVVTEVAGEQQDRLLAETLQRECEEADQREALFEQFKQDQLGATVGLTDEELAARLQEVENRVNQVGVAGSVPPENPIGPRSSSKKDKNCIIL